VLKGVGRRWQARKRAVRDTSTSGLDAVTGIYTLRFASALARSMDSSGFAHGVDAILA